MDSHSAVNEAFLKHLIREKLLRFGNRGIRTVVDLDVLIVTLNNLLGFSDEHVLPKIRTIRNAAIELRTNEDNIGIGETHIRRCVADQKIGFIKIGNRHYVAMQSFEPPYSEGLVYGTSPGDKKRVFIRDNIIEQLNLTITSGSAIPIVKRKREE